MVLLRSHCETAALATYFLQELTESARNHDPKKLSEIIPKTLFGTALKKHRERDVVSELLTMTEGATVRISHAVDAMDNYYYREAAEGKLAVVYSLLCEVSHPNHRSALDFMQAAERPDGWLVTYQRDPFENAEMPKYALEVLLVSMRSGYASAEMLRCWGFSGREESTIRWEPPTMSDHSRISVDLLTRPAFLTGSPTKPQFEPSRSSWASSTPSSRTVPALALAAGQWIANAEPGYASRACFVKGYEAEENRWFVQHVGPETWIPDQHPPSSQASTEA